MSCPAHISQNDLPEFPSAALLSVNDATASSPFAALQIENSSCAILPKVNGTRHQSVFKPSHQKHSFKIGHKSKQFSATGHLQANRLVS
ncbi:MAG TPA: hypothetical protein DF613_13925 [Lachnospiraceae bacterium]|nr:hypothetical protein [Lachnospiraceae bacterium]